MIKEYRDIIQCCTSFMYLILLQIRTIVFVWRITIAPWERMHKWQYFMILRQHFLTLVKYGNYRENEINEIVRYSKFPQARNIPRYPKYFCREEFLDFRINWEIVWKSKGKIKVISTLVLQNFIEDPRLDMISKIVPEQR